MKLMSLRSITIVTTLVLTGSGVLRAQVVATERAAPGLPGVVGPAAPKTPGGGAVIGNNFWAGDEAQGFRHYAPVDPNNPDPINTGLLKFDIDQSFSVGGGGLCMPFCSVGQIASDGLHVYVAAYDKQTGQPFSARFPGVNRFTIGADGRPFDFQPLAVRFGLAGNQPTSIAIGPDGNLYVGFVKNGNVVRITDPNGLNQPADQIVQSVGTSPQGRPVHGLAFVGPDLYLASTDGLSVIKSAVAPTCMGGCNAVRLNDGFNGTEHVGITTDGINRLYLSLNGVGVFRYTINSTSMTLVSNSGSDAVTGALIPFAFAGGHSNLLLLDRLGNLWIGDDPSDVNFSGRIWTISAAALATIP
jgi:hypothetical protein